jgi:hypothetical protein
MAAQRQKPAWNSWSFINQNQFEFSLFSLFYFHEGNPVWLTFLLFAFMPLAGRRKARTRE